MLIHNMLDIWKFGNILKRDQNLLFTYDGKNKQRYGTNPSITLEATCEVMDKKEKFNVVKFMKNFYLTKKKRKRMCCWNFRTKSKIKYWK